MNKTVFSQFAQRLYGTSGRFWPELGTLEAVWRHSFLDQYPDGERAAEESVQRYCAGTSRFPSRFRMRYAQEDGVNVLTQNMNRVVGSCCSLKRVRNIQQDVHDWLKEETLEGIDMSEVNRYVVSEDASCEKIATYLALVLHMIIVAS